MFAPETKFLITEDLHTIRTLIKEFLKRLGYDQMAEADNGLMAWNKLEEAHAAGEPFQFMISDWNMPEMTGLELLKKCRGDDRFKDLPILMVTIESEKAYVLKAVTMGVDDFVVKPFSEKTLESKIANIFQRRQQK